MRYILLRMIARLKGTCSISGVDVCERDIISMIHAIEGFRDHRDSATMPECAALCYRNRFGHSETYDWLISETHYQ